MSSSGNHYFQSRVLEYISKSYERLIFKNYRQDLENSARNVNLNDGVDNDNDNVDNDNVV